jgi:hypothetical protein
LVLEERSGSCAGNGVEATVGAYIYVLIAGFADGWTWIQMGDKNGGHKDKIVNMQIETTYKIIK